MAMRLGGTHKSGIERALVTVRARIETALDALEQQEGIVHTELEEAAKALRGLELHFSSQRRRPSASAADLLEDHSSTSADTRAFLLRNFTEHDEETAAAHVEIQSSTSSPSMCKRRSSGHQVAEEAESAMAIPEVTRILANVGAMDFDALALAGRMQAELQCISVFGACVVKRDRLFWEMEEKGWIASTGKFTQAWLAFCNRLDNLYLPDAIYHSSAHAVDVAATTHWLMKSDYMDTRITRLDHFLGIAAALMHDVGHPGQNNLWHQKTMSPLALRYNDKSILENMHVALAFETMQGDPECDWFAMLQRSSEGTDSNHVRAYARRGLISMVLATDMAKHSSHVQQLKTMAEEFAENSDHDLRPTNSESEKEEQQKALARKLFVLETVVHAADISNPSKPREIMLGWTRRVLSEFWAQGDEERRLGLEISPLCDRESGLASVPRGQLGFISFVVLPFFSPLAVLLTEAQEAVDELKKNQEFWKDQDTAWTAAAFEGLFGGPPLRPPRAPSLSE